jgi:hypothetical protein
MVVIWSFCTFSFFVIPYYLEAIPDSNLYLMSTATGVAEILASIICLRMESVMETRKKVALFSLISCFGTIAISLISGKGNSEHLEAVGYLI